MKKIRLISVVDDAVCTEVCFDNNWKKIIDVEKDNLTTGNIQHKPFFFGTSHCIFTISGYVILNNELEKRAHASLLILHNFLG